MTLRNYANRDQIVKFLTLLGQRFQNPGQIYLVADIFQRAAAASPYEMPF